MVIMEMAIPNPAFSVLYTSYGKRGYMETKMISNYQRFYFHATAHVLPRGNGGEIIVPHSLSLLSTAKTETLLKTRSQVEDDITVDNSTVLVVGGGGLGMEVVRKLAKAGSWVTVLQRSEKFRKEVEELGVMLAIGDVLDPTTLQRVFESNSFDAIICTVGGGNQNPIVDKDGPINLVNAATKYGVKRFLLVSSIGVGDSAKAVPQQTLQVLRAVLNGKEVAEQKVKESGLVYTIIRPGGLVDGPPSGKGVLTEDTTVLGLITRAELAFLISAILFNKCAEMKTLSAIDSERLLPPTTSLDGVKILSVLQ